MGQPGRQALRRFSRHFVPWALARTEPGRSPHPSRTECRFEDPQIEVRGLSLEAARIQYEGRQALSCNGCSSDRFGPIPSGAPLAKPRKVRAGMGPVRT